MKVPFPRGLHALRLAARGLLRFSLSRDAVYLGEHRAITRTVWGNTIFVDTRDISIVPHLLLKGFWEPHVTRVILKLLKPGMCVVDVGASFGYYTLLAAFRVAHQGRVFAFEANPRAVELLSQSIAVNGAHNTVTLEHYAVLDRSTIVPFHPLQKYAGGSSIIAFEPAFLQKYRDQSETIQVKSISLDEYFALRPEKIDLVKIDAEGSEPYILKGMTNVINQNPKLTIICEFSPALITGAGSNPKSFLQEILAHGFSLRYISQGSKLIPITLENLLHMVHCELLLTRTTSRWLSPRTTRHS